MVNTPARLLIMGFRKGLLQALKKRGLDYALWSDREIPEKYKPQFFLKAEFPRETTELESRIEGWGHFTHVIAAVEAAVYPASLLRRPLKARLSKDSVLLRCHDKLKMKRYLSEFEIPMTDFIEGDSELSNEEIVGRLGLPVVVKCRDLSGGRGMTLAKHAEALKEFRVKTYIFERFVKATEASIESFVHNGQIEFQNITYYRTPGFTNLLPSHQGLAECAEIQKLNEKILRSLGIQWGISHLEVYNTPEGPLFGEIALRPPGGYLMDLISLSYGFNAWEAFLAVELGEDFDFSSKVQSWSASMILHPGEGRFKELRGQSTVESLESVKKFAFKKTSDKFISARKGVGEELGHVILSHPNQDQLLKDLMTCERELHFEKLFQT